MPSAGTTRRAARRPAAPWWEELDREAFREFPGVRGSRAVQRSRTVRASGPVRDTSTVAPPEPRSDVARGPVRAPARVAVAAHVGVAEQVEPAEFAGPADRAGLGEADRSQWPTRAANGRRTVTIRGYGAERNLPVARPTLRRHERPGFKPDRAALWAVVLGLFLILVAAASAHAAVAHHLAGLLIR